MKTKQNAFDRALQAALKAKVSPRAIKPLVIFGTDVVRATKELTRLTAAKKSKKVNDDDKKPISELPEKKVEPLPKKKKFKGTPMEHKGARAELARQADQIRRVGAAAAGVTLERFVGAAKPPQTRLAPAPQRGSTKQAKAFLDQMNETARINAGLPPKKRG